MYVSLIRILWVILTVFSLEQVAWTCGFEWPTPLLADSDRALRTSPEASFDEEAERILAVYATGEIRRVNTNEYDRSRLGGEETASRDINDISQDPLAHRTTLTKPAGLLDQYADIRRKLREYIDVSDPNQGQDSFLIESRKRELTGPNPRGHSFGVFGILAWRYCVPHRGCYSGTLALAGSPRSAFRGAVEHALCGRPI